MQKRFHYLFAAILLTCTLSRSFAQTDPHFTQSYIYPLYVNPAMTGSGNGDYRVAGVFRNQWRSISNPYSTVGASFDTRTNNNLALGVNLLNQSAGDGGFNYLHANASVAYTGVKLGTDGAQKLVFALQAGIMSRRVDPTRFKWGEQWNPITGYNENNAVTESFAATGSTVLDIGAGVLYYDGRPGRKANVYGGASVFHINRPKDPIISSGNVALMTIPVRYALHGGVSLNMSERTRLVPNVLFMKQGTARELMLGTYMQMNVNPQTDVMFGGYYRIGDAVSPFVGVDWKDFLVGLSYDLNASKLGAMSRNVNAFELSLSYTKKRPGKNVIDYLRCPRL